MENPNTRAAILIIAAPVAVLLGYLLFTFLYQHTVGNLPEPRDANEAVAVGESSEIAYVLSCAGSILLVSCTVIPLLLWVMWWEYRTE